MVNDPDMTHVIFDWLKFIFGFNKFVRLKLSQISFEKGYHHLNWLLFKFEALRSSQK